MTVVSAKLYIQRFPAPGRRRTLHDWQHGTRVIDRARRRFGATAATSMVHRRRWWLAHAHGKSGLHRGSWRQQLRARGVEQLLSRVCWWTAHRRFAGVRCTRTAILSCTRARDGLRSVFRAASGDEFRNLNVLTDEKIPGSVFLEITTRVDSALNKQLPRPKETLAQFRDAVYGFLQTKSMPAQ